MLDFVERVSAEGIPPEERVAVFDNDGTLWCEKPLPIQADFILRRLAEMAEADPALREQQPWKAAYDRDYAWLGQVMASTTRATTRTCARSSEECIAAHAGISVDDFEQQADAFLHTARIRRSIAAIVQCVYAPMVELLALPGGERVHELHRLGRRPRLHAADQRRDVRHPARSGDRELDRARLPGRTRTIMRKPEADVLDDGPEKPVRIWSRIGRRPILAAGNSNGDIAMLDFTQHEDKPALRLLVLHDDDEREFDYTGGSREGARPGGHARAGPWSASRATGGPSSPTSPP